MWTDQLIRALFQDYSAGFHFFPPLFVENFRPSAAVTVAFGALSAETAMKSPSTGGAIFFHVFASFVIRIKPSRPTSQQTSADGAAPAIRTAPAEASSPCHVAPPSVDRSTNPEPAKRHRIAGSGVRIVVGPGCTPTVTTWE